MNNAGKKTTIIVIVTLLLSLVVCCVGLPAGVLYWLRPEFGSGKSYTLTADGDRLFVVENSSQKEFVIEDGKPSGITFESEFNKEIVIKDAISENRQKVDFAYNYFWSRNHEAVYFFNQIYRGQDESTELWQWTPKKNFERLHVFEHDVSNLHESLDGKYLTGTYYDFGDVPKSGVVIYDISGHTAKLIESNEQMLEAVMIAPDRILIAGNPAEIWTPSVNKVSVTGGKGDVDQLTVFRGEVWALKYENEKFQIVKFAPDGMLFAKVIDFPADFPKVTQADRMGD